MDQNVNENYSNFLADRDIRMMCYKKIYGYALLFTWILFLVHTSTISSEIGS